MPDVAIANRNTSAAPKDYVLPYAQEILIKAVTADIDGTSAAGQYLPALQILSDAGDVMWTAVDTSTVIAAGASVSPSWFRLTRTKAPSRAPSPNPLGTLWAWWDFSDTTTITLDGSSKITEILDKTGNGHNATQATAANRPSESTLNALNCGIFNSANKTALITSGWPSALTQPFTVSLVWTQSIVSSATYQPGPIGGAPSPPPAILFDGFDGTSLVMEQGVGSIIKTFPAPYTQQLATMIFNAGSSSFRLNGTATAGTVDGDTMTNFALGTSHYPTNPSILQFQDGKIGEVLVYEGSLTAAQLSAVESYLKAKWGTP